MRRVHRARGRPHRPQQVYSGGGTDGNPRWLPTLASPHDKATWELIATVPAALTVVSNGRLVSDRKVAGGLRTTHWSQDKPASTYLISLVAAPLVRIQDRWRDVPLSYYVYPEDSAIDVLTAPDSFETVRNAMEAAGLKPDLAEVTMRADNDIAVEGETAQQVARLLRWLEDLDDVQNVYSNADLGDATYA